MASLKSSVASKTTAAAATAAASASAVAPPCSDGHNALCSTWISRLRLRSLPLSSSRCPPPPPRSSSTLESRTPPPPKPHRHRYPPRHPVNGFGFGPFRVRDNPTPHHHHHHHKRSWNVPESKSRSFSFLCPIARIPEINDSSQDQINFLSRDENWDRRGRNGVQMSPFFRSQPTNSHRIDDLSSYTRNQKMKRTVDSEILHVDPWIASTSSQHESRIRGGAYGNGAEDNTTTRVFCDPNVMHQDIVSQNSKRQMTACSNEPDESFSYWNMGRFRRKNTITSVLPTIGFTDAPGSKRKSTTSNWVSLKCRKLGSEG